MNGAVVFLEISGSRKFPVNADVMKEIILKSASMETITLAGYKLKIKRVDHEISSVTQTPILEVYGDLVEE